MLRRLEIWLVLLLALAMGVAVWAGNRSGGGTPDFDFRASAFPSGPRGSSATYEGLPRLRIPVERGRTPPLGLERDARRRPAVLVVLGPPLDRAAAQLAPGRRVAGGGRGGAAASPWWPTSATSATGRGAPPRSPSSSRRCSCLAGVDVWRGTNTTRASARSAQSSGSSWAGSPGRPAGGRCCSSWRWGPPGGPRRRVPSGPRRPGAHRVPPLPPLPPARSPRRPLGRARGRPSPHPPPPRAG